MLCFCCVREDKRPWWKNSDSETFGNCTLCVERARFLFMWIASGCCSGCYGVWINCLDMSATSGQCFKDVLVKCATITVMLSC